MTREAQASGDVTAGLWSDAVGVGWQWYLAVFFLLLPGVLVQEFGCDSVNSADIRHGCSSCSVCHFGWTG